MSNLKLIAFDIEDLAVISAHLQDAVLHVGDLRYLQRDKRLVAIVNRFDWEGAIAGAAAGRKDKKSFERRQSALRFERVLGAKLTGIDLWSKSQVLSLLAVTFEPKSKDDPEGFVTLMFAAGAAVRLHVECLEAELKDLGAAWRARRKPNHPDDNSAASA